jgi:hypothetical protein
LYNSINKVLEYFFKFGKKKIMQTYSVEILNPKAFKLLEDLVDLQLISMKKEKVDKNKPTDIKDLLLNGPTWTDDEYQEYLKNREAINAIGK